MWSSLRPLPILSIWIALASLFLSGCQGVGDKINYIETVNVYLPAGAGAGAGAPAEAVSMSIATNESRGGQTLTSEIAAEVAAAVEAALEDSPFNVQGGTSGNTESAPSP